MSDFIEMRERLQETHTALSQIENAILANPNDWSLGITAESLRQREHTLETAFFDAANSAQIDICSYRLIRDDSSSYPIIALSDTLSSFQLWLTAVFDSIRNGPKKSSRSSIEIVEQTRLDFGYAFSGSLGFTFTIPNERLLFGSSDLDKSIEIMFEMLRSESPDVLVKFAHDLGVPIIRRMYDWASSHSGWNVSADIKWRRKEEIRNAILIQPPEATRLCEIIRATSEIEEESISISGILAGADVDTRNFHMTFPDGEEISGKMDDAFTYADQLLGKTYSARLTKRTTTYFATDKEETIWRLLSLEN